MDKINQSSENEILNNHNRDNTDGKDVKNANLNDKKEEKDELQVLNHKDDSILLKDIQHIINVSVNITVKLGRAKIKIEDLLNISMGSVLILDKKIGEPLDIFVNESLIARGEIVVVEDKYGIRITSIIDSSKNVNI
ncbi:flagellar motor switch protein FliN [Buchnera aphidicola]|uniref:flagellar motor switch protein FliN n=1 Tax=Buchnera aphidicola TaxID=9 RepID=UPI0034641EE8